MTMPAHRPLWWNYTNETGVELYLMQDSFTQPVGHSGLNEIQILGGNPSSVVGTVLQGQARTRRRLSLDCWVTSVAAYNTLRDDYYFQRDREFYGPHNYYMWSIISNLTPRRQVFAHHIEFSIEFIEY